MVKICPKCQKENVDKNNFCEYCGSDLPKIEEEKKEVKAIINDSKDTIEDNVVNVKSKVDEVITEEKITNNKRNIKKQEEKIAKNKESISKQKENIVANHYNDELSSLNNWKYKLFYWKDNQTGEYKISKTKIISLGIFCLFTLSACRLYFSPSYMQAHGGGIVHIIPAVIIGLIFAIPVFIIGFIIHYMRNR